MLPESLTSISTSITDLRGKAARNKAINDPNYLCVRILGYDLMDNPFNRDVANFFRKTDRDLQVALFTPRSTYKSTFLVADIIRSLLMDPNHQIFFVHHRLENAKEIVQEVGRHIQFNDKVRELFPREVLPSKQEKFLTDDQFTLKNRNPNCRHPSLQAFSLNMNLTGKHPTKVYLDDLVNTDSVRETVGGMDAIENWVRTTLANIRGLNPNARVRLAGTPYSKSDFHWKIITRQDKGWRVYLRALTEDPKTRIPTPIEDGGEPIPLLIPDSPIPRYLNKKDVQRVKDSAKSSFPSQYMMMPTKDLLTIWKKDVHEHYIKPADIQQYINKIVVINDPAPVDKTSYYSHTASKDDWAIAVIAYGIIPGFKGSAPPNGLVPAMNSPELTRRDLAGGRLVRILIDGAFSNTWTLDQGIRRTLDFVYKYNTPLVAFEEPVGSARALKPFGTRCEELAKLNGLHVKTITLKSVFTGKGVRVQDLAAIAENNSFFILKDTIPPAFLDKFLEQVRTWAGPDKSSHDDVLDAVSYLDDPAIREYLPKVVPKARGIFSQAQNTYKPQRNLGKYF